MDKAEAMLWAAAAMLLMALIYFFCPWLIWRGYERGRMRKIAGWGFVLVACVCVLIAAMFAIIERVENSS